MLYGGTKPLKKLCRVSIIKAALCNSGWLACMAGRSVAGRETTRELDVFAGDGAALRWSRTRSCF